MMAVKILFFFYLLVTLMANIIEAATLNSGNPEGLVKDPRRNANKDCKTCRSIYHTTEQVWLKSAKEPKEISNAYLDKNPDIQIVQTTEGNGLRSDLSNPNFQTPNIRNDKQAQVSTISNYVVKIIDKVIKGAKSAIDYFAKKI